MKILVGEPSRCKRIRIGILIVTLGALTMFYGYVYGYHGIVESQIRLAEFLIQGQSFGEKWLNTSIGALFWWLGFVMIVLGISEIVIGIRTTDSTDPHV